MNKQLGNYIRRTVRISDAELQMVCSKFQSKTVRKGEYLLPEGQKSKHTYFVLNGCLRIYFINEDGQESTRYLAFENHLATALVSYIDGAPSLEQIQALEETELLYISHENFDKLRQQHPIWETFYTAYLEKAYSKTVSRLLTFTTMNAKERYINLLNINPEIVRRLPNKIVASYLNVSQETLSRIKGKI